MNKTTPLYSKAGDTGTTTLSDQSVVKKNDPRVIAIADIEQTNATLGITLCEPSDLDASTKRLLGRIQNHLFDLGADLALPDSKKDSNSIRIKEKDITYLEEQIDYYNNKLSKPTSLILPGGSYAAAHLHLSRIICRKAERSTWNAVESFPNSVNPLIGKYLNRLADLLFVLARFTNKKDDIYWVSDKYKNEPSDYQILIEL